jgi:hypothetical protein
MFFQLIVFELYEPGKIILEMTLPILLIFTFCSFRKQIVFRASNRISLNNKVPRKEKHSHKL